MRTAAIYLVLTVTLIVPIAVAANSPLLEWREPLYILAGLAGVIGLCMLLLQPLFAGRVLPGVAAQQSKRIHRWVGVALVIAVVIHIVGLWVTSPPDVIDALLFRSPTPFSLWGVIAMWAVFGAALLALLRKRIIQSLGGKRGLRLWYRAHTTLAVLIVGGTVVHALLIEGTMGLLSKWVLCLAVVGATTSLVVIKKG